MLNIEPYPEQLKKIQIRIIGNFTLAKQKHKLQCLNCDYIWMSTPISKLQSFKKYGVNGCPNCNKQRKNQRYNKSRTDSIETIKKLGFHILSSYSGQQTTTTKIKVKRNECGHVFECAPGNILHRDVICKICNNEKKRVRFQTINQNKHIIWKQTASEWEIYKSDVNNLTQQTYKKHQKLINPDNLSRGVAGTDGSFQLDHIIPIRWCFENNVPVEACADFRNLQMLSWRDNLAKKNKIDLEIEHIPPHLSQYLLDGNSNESIIVNIKKQLQSNGVIINNDQPLNPYNIHINVPDKKICIRLFDLYKDSEQSTDSQKVLFNINKMAAIKGIRVIQIFSDEWYSNKQLVIEKLLYLCGKPTATQTIYARNCIIKPIDSDLKNTFLNHYHLQGADKSAVNLGAFSKNNPDRLLAVMTFCKPRVALGVKTSLPQGTWELSRFCTDYDVRIPGIASKMLTFFQRNYEWVQIYSYADKRWSNGNVYNKLGFKEVKHNPPSYWYVVDGSRKHRWNYRKDMLKKTYSKYDSNKTEYHMMLEQGIDRVWDVGTIKYELTL